MTVIRGAAARYLVAKARRRQAGHLEHTSHGSPLSRASTVVPAGPDAATLAEAFIRDLLTSNDAAHRLDDTGLVAHELVMNAHTHGRGHVVLTLIGLTGGRLLVKVRDAGPVTAALHAARHRHRATRALGTATARPTPPPPGGCGLEIIGVLTRDWGVLAQATGKQVWALLDEELA